MVDRVKQRPLGSAAYEDADRRAARDLGQVVGRLNTVRPTKDVIFDMVEEWIETTQRLNTLIDA
jgi:NAD(P)H-dependent flavin oxidoreductase YrpB (nitropropane dioxygenase family)